MICFLCVFVFQLLHANFISRDGYLIKNKLSPKIHNGGGGESIHVNSSYETASVYRALTAVIPLKPHACGVEEFGGGTDFKARLYTSEHM